MATAQYLASSRAAVLGKIGAFNHFNMSTFTGTENDGGNGPLTNRRAVGTFVPYSSSLDAQTKIGAAFDKLVAAGVTYIIPVCSHGGEYCIWHSTVNGYNCVDYDGQPDILSVMVAAAKARGLGVGVYHGMVGGGYQDASADAYVARLLAELREIIATLNAQGVHPNRFFLDGGKTTGASQVVGGITYTDSWSASRAQIELLEPAALVDFNYGPDGAAAASDMQLFEELSNYFIQTVDSATPQTGVELHDSIFVQMAPGQGSYWFDDPAGNHALKTKAQIRASWHIVQKYAGAFLLNIPFGTSGTFTTTTSAYLASLGNLAVGTKDIAIGAATSASSCFPSKSNPVGTDGDQYGPQNIVNGSMNYWTGGFFSSDTTLDPPASATASATITLSAIAKTEGVFISWANDGREGYNKGVFAQLLDANNLVLATTSIYNDDGSQSPTYFCSFDFPAGSQAKSIVIKQKPGANRAGGMTITAANVWSGGAASPFVTAVLATAPLIFHPTNDPTGASYLIDLGSRQVCSLAVSDTTGVTSVASPFAGGDTAILLNGSTHGYEAVGATNFTDNFTMMVGVLPTSLPQNSPRVMTMGASNTGGEAIVVGDGNFGSGSKLYGEVATVAGIFGSNVTLGTSTPVLAFLSRVNSTWQIYVGGSLIATDSGHAPQGPGNAITIGAECLAGPSFSLHFAGTIAGDAYWSPALSATQIIAITNASNAIVLTAGVPSLKLIGDVATLTWTSGGNGSLTITGQAQFSLDGITWTNFGSAATGAGSATLSNATVFYMYRVKFDDGVSASVYSIVVPTASQFQIPGMTNFLGAGLVSLMGNHPQGL